MSAFFRKSKDTPKYFCLSMQRSGTTSVGKFFRDHGIKCAGWSTSIKNGWSNSYWDGDIEKIFNAKDFQKNSAFEDGPWFHPGFFKILYHRFPQAKFVLLTRDPHAWFLSVCSHSHGQALGQSRIHSKIYRREEEFFHLLQAAPVKSDHGVPSPENLSSMTLAGHEEHYQKLYQLHTQEVIDFFARHNPSSLHVGSLDDPEKWQKIGAFIGIEVSSSYQCHENASPN